MGEFSVSAIADGSSDPELYWHSSASFLGSVAKAIPEIAFTSGISKVYDGQPVTDPGVTTNSPGTVSYSYTTQDGKAPKDAGEYTVTATVAETDLYESTSADLAFTIESAPTSLGLELSQNGDTGVAKATVAGLYEADGVVRFTFAKEDETYETTEVAVGSDYIATLNHGDLPAGMYTVVAEYVSGGNYKGSDASATGSKDRSTPEILYTGGAKSYADYAFNLNISVWDDNERIDQKGSNKVDVSYEIVWDLYEERGFEKTVQLNSDISGGSFTILHAGKALVKIMATPKESYAGTYNTAVAYVPISVAPVELTVTSYVHERGKDEVVRQETYGNLFGLESALSYKGLVSDPTHGRDDTPENFTHGHGTLSAMPLAATTGATDAITPAQLAVETDDATKTFDGTPLTASGGTILGLVKGETATLRTTGSQTEVGSSKNTYEIVWDGTAKQDDYEVVHEDLGTLWVTEPSPDIMYTCTQGAGGTWTRGSDAALTFVYERSQDEQATFEHFAGVMVDGKTLPASAYDAKSGSVVLSLKPNYLQGLSAGTHALEPQFDDGTAQKVGFTIIDAKSGKTDDSSGATSQNGSTRNAAGTTVSRAASRTAVPNTADSSFHDTSFRLGSQGGQAP